MATETIEISGKVKQVITNTVTVKRTAQGLTLTVTSPEIHAWLKERCELRTLGADPREGWPREGKVLFLTPSGTANRLPPCLNGYNTEVLNLDDDTVNLAVLRHEKAAEGPVSMTMAGVYSFEEAQAVLQKAQATIASIFRDHMREYSGTSTIKIIR